MNIRVKILFMVIAILMAIVLALAGCATQGAVRVEGESGSVTVDVHRGERDYRSTLPDIPPGICLHLECAGSGYQECRQANNPFPVTAESLNMRFRLEHSLLEVNSGSLCSTNYRNYYGKMRHAVQ